MEALEIIEAFNILHIAESVGEVYLSPEQLAILRKYKLNPTEGMSLSDVSFRFGILANALQAAELDKMNWQQFKRHLERNPIPLTRLEKNALDQVKFFEYREIMKLNGRHKEAVSAKLSEWDLKQMEYYDLARAEAKKNMTRRGTISELISTLRDASGDMQRDHAKMADYISQYSWTRGKASSIMSKSGADAKVWIRVHQYSCKHCLRLYRKADRVEPIVFKVSELVSNGTNIGRKVADWKPCLPPVHPYCRCTLNKLLPGYAWDAEKGEFTLQRTGQGKRKSRVKVKVTRD